MLRVTIATLPPSLEQGEKPLRCSVTGMTGLAPCSNSSGRNVCLCTGRKQELACGRLEVGRHRGPVSWSRRIGPHVTFQPTVSCRRSPYVPVSRLPQRRDRVPSGAGYSHKTTLCQGCAGGVEQSGGALVLALTCVVDLDSRTGGRFVVNVIDRVMSVRSRYYTLFGP